MSKADRLVKLMKIIPESYLHANLGYVDGPTSDIHQVDNDWTLSSEVWEDLSIKENEDDIDLFIKIDLDELPDDEMLVTYLQTIIKNIQDKK